MLIVLSTYRADFFCAMTTPPPAPPPPTSALIEISRISEALENQVRFRYREDATKKKIEKKVDP